MTPLDEVPWTKGKWKTRENGIGHKAVVTARGDWITYQAGSDRMPLPEIEANARLIAESPTMAALLDRIESHISGGAINYEEGQALRAEVRALLSRLGRGK